MPDARKVRIVEENGDTVYNGLLDDGGPVLRFEVPPGFIVRSEVKPDQRIEEGWLTRDEMDAERKRRWPHL